MVALLHRPYQIGPDTRGAERRMFPRKEVHARIDGMRLDHTIQATHAPQVSLALRDLSLGGLSAVSQTPLNHGEPAFRFFSRHRGRRAAGTPMAASSAASPAAWATASLSNSTRSPLRK